MLDPLLPRFLRDVLVQSLAELARVRREVEAFGFASIAGMSFRTSGADAVLILASGDKVVLDGYLLERSLADLGEDDFVL